MQGWRAARLFVVPLLAVALAACSLGPTASPAAAPTSRPPASATASAAASASGSAATSEVPGSPTVAPSAGASASAAPTGTTTPTPRPTPTQAPTPGPTGSVSTATMVGQQLVVAMAGLTPSAGLLARIKAGQVGGVILFGFNVSDAAQVKALTARLQQAAADGGQPRLIIATDQEGGGVKRIPWAAPTMSPPQIGATGDASVARTQGQQTGQALRDLGINVDLAPVADLPFSTSSILYQQGRTFSLDANLNATLVDAFAAGMLSAGVKPVLKHFPGLGYATHDTDTTVVTMNLTKAGMAPGWLPYQRASALPMVMVSNAVYTVFDAANGAGWSATVVSQLLRAGIGFKGVAITDSLTGAATARGVAVGTLAVKASAAGMDLILVTDGEATTAGVYDQVLAAARAGTIPTTTLRAAYDRIIALKAGLS